jgi:hypothetical protein
LAHIRRIGPVLAIHAEGALHSLPGSISVQETSNMAEPSTQESTEERSGIAGIPMAVAILAILVWVAFLIVMLSASDSNETEWVRLTYVFASVEAVAFAAAGALFGVTVQRERVKAAEDKASANERDAASGRALALATMADGGQLVGQDADSTFESYGAKSGQDDVRLRHAQMARTLFPDLP